MKIGVVVNPAAGSAEQSDDLIRLINSHEQLALYCLNGSGHTCEDAVRHALSDRCDIIAAAGGDGTVHDVLNALMRAGAPAALGVVPIGTGNDLARTLGLGLDPRDALAQLSLGRIEQLDVMQIRHDSTTFYGLNAVTGGFGGDVTESLSGELKAAFGSLAYIIGTVSALPNRDEYELVIGYDDDPLERVQALAVVAANGRTVAGGKRVAPQANPQDGLLDVLLVKPSSMVNLADVGARLMAGNILGSRHVAHRRAGRIRIAGEAAMQFNVDGETMGSGKMEIVVLPGAAPVVVGSEYQAVVES